MNAESGVADSFDGADQLTETSRVALRELMLVLADCKRLLGIRYADFILGAPSLESGIAAASMAQDEWGHARLTYALLADFGDDPKALEHQRGAREYRACEMLDKPFRSWVEVIVAGLLFDTALSLQYDSLASSRYLPARNRVQKMLDEERFHFQHAVSWVRRLAQSEGAGEEVAETIARVLPIALRWFGRSNQPGSRYLLEQGLVDQDADALRERLLASVGPLIDELGLAERVGIHQEHNGWSHQAPLDWTEWDEVGRRGPSGSGPDADTLARVRGDNNRVFLIE